MYSAVSTRILVIAPNWIGDCVMAQPLLALLKQQYPELAIDVLAASWVAPVWRAMAEVDTVLETPFKHGALQLRERWLYAQMLRQRGYRAAYVLPNTLKFALVPWLAGIKQRIGYKGENRNGLITVMHHDDPKAPRAMVPFYAALATAPCRATPAQLPRPALQVSSEKLSEVLNALGISTQDPLIAFAPGAEFGNAKRWTASHFAQLADIILQAHPKAQIVLLGSPKGVAACNEIQALCPSVRPSSGRPDHA